MSTVGDILYSVSIVLSNFPVLANEEDHNGYALNESTAFAFNVQGINNLVRHSVGMQNIRLRNTGNNYHCSYSVTLQTIENEPVNIISSSSISVNLNQNGSRIDQIFGAGSYINYFGNIADNYEDNVLSFSNALSGQNIGILPSSQDMLGLYFCEISRSPSSLVTVPMFYSMYNVNTLNNVIDSLQNNNQDNNNLIFNDILLNLTEDNHASLFPPIFLPTACRAIKSILSGVGINYINQFFQALDFGDGFGWKYNNNNDDNSLLRGKEFLLLQELFIINWFNNQQNQINIPGIDLVAEQVNNILQEGIQALENDRAQREQQFLNMTENQQNEIGGFENYVLDDLNFTRKNALDTYLEDYTGIELTNIQSNALILAIINFFNDSFNIGFNEDNINGKLQLTNQILNNPDQTNNLLIDFNNPVPHENAMEVEDPMLLGNNGD